MPCNYDKCPENGHVTNGSVCQYTNCGENGHVTNASGEMYCAIHRITAGGKPLFQDGSLFTSEGSCSCTPWGKTGDCPLYEKVGPHKIVPSLPHEKNTNGSVWNYRVQYISGGDTYRTGLFFERSDVPSH